jgi:hypothetical protein
VHGKSPKGAEPAFPVFRRWRPPQEHARARTHAESRRRRSEAARPVATPVRSAANPRVLGGTAESESESESAARRGAPLRAFHLPRCVPSPGREALRHATLAVVHGVLATAGLGRNRPALRVPAESRASALARKSRPLRQGRRSRERLSRGTRNVGNENPFKIIIFPRRGSICWPLSIGNYLSPSTESLND